MKQAHFHFFESLNDFLPEDKRAVCFSIDFNGSQSVKHLIEALGVPHTEVYRILVNETAVGFDYLVQQNDRIHVFPMPVDIVERGVIPGIAPDILPRFVVDNHLGRLAAYLRMLGFDTLYNNDFQDKQLAEITSQEKRWLLTRDRRLLMRKVVVHGYYVRATLPRRQLVEVIRRFDLFELILPFQRCLRCNGRLLPVSKDAVLNRLEPLTKKYYDEFRMCKSCGKVYWKGSHFQRMNSFISQLLRDCSK